MAALCVAGLCQEVLLLWGQPGLGIFLVAPALTLVLALWLPRLEAVACVALALGVEAALHLHTGGTRYSDWLLHYELARNYGGLPNHALASLIPGRTALFHQLAGALLAHAPGFEVFQVVSVLLNSLWLWPATLLLKRANHAQPRGRLLALALGPFVLAYSVYTWPWGFSAFFVLTAVLLAMERSKIAAAGTGLALAGALLVHPGALGYVAGLGIFVLARGRHRLTTAVAAAAALLTSVPWVINVSGGDPGGLLRASVPARQAVALPVWALTRLLTAAASFFPAEAMPGDRAFAHLVIAIFVLTIPGALGLAFVALRHPPAVPGAARAAILGGVVIGLLIYPPNNSLTGMLDALYCGVVLVLVFAAAEADDRGVSRLLVLQAAALALFLGCLFWVSNAPGPGDGNLVLKVAYGVSYIADSLGPLPGVLLALAAAGAALMARRRELSAG